NVAKAIMDGAGRHAPIPNELALFVSAAIVLYQAGVLVLGRFGVEVVVDGGEIGIGRTRFRGIDAIQMADAVRMLRILTVVDVDMSVVHNGRCNNVIACAATS